MGCLKLEGFFVLSSPGQREALSLSYLLKDANKVPKNPTLELCKFWVFFLTRVLVPNEVS